MIQRHGWILLFHECLIEQLKKLEAVVAQARTNDPQCFASNANVKLFNALAQLILETIPSDPGHDRYQQGNTLGPPFRHWRRTKIGRRFRLFFRYNAQAKIIIFAWVNDTHNLRSAGSKTDPYVVFRKMLDSGHPPDDWTALLAASKAEWIPKS